jgi:outer membrane receptor protein involved in Fe transport
MLVMGEDKAAPGLCRRRNGRRLDLALAALLSLIWAQCALAVPRHFELPAGDAGVTLNRFGEQAGIQLLFDFKQLAGQNTNEVLGDYEPLDALKKMLDGTPIRVAVVNNHTLALTLNDDTSTRHHWWQRRAGPPPPPPAQLPTDALDEVLIAGSNMLYQPPPVGASLIQLSRPDIEHSGFATAQELIRTLPQVFGGGPSEDTQLIGREAPTNSTKGSGINLRGLDAGATLVLIDGQRTAPSGGQGLFADVSSIPLSAIDHIDILPDGASAQYGADAIGGVVNFVLRSHFTGSETLLRDGDLNGNPLGGRQLSQLLGGRFGSSMAMVGFEWYDRGALPASDRRLATSNLAPFGGTDFDVPYGSPGSIMVGEQTWAIPAGATGKSLATVSLVPGTQNLYDQWAGADVLPDQERWSAFGTLRSEITDRIELSGDALFTRRKMSIAETGAPLISTVTPVNPYYFSPTGGTDPVTVLSGTQAYFGTPDTALDLDTGNVSVGVSVRLTGSWSLSGRVGYTFENEDSVTRGLADPAALDAALNDSDPATAFDPYGDASVNNPATLAMIARTGLYSSWSNIRIATLSAAGSLFRAPGGHATLAVGAEYRGQRFDTESLTVGVANPVPAPDSIPTRLDLRRDIGAGFAELRVPLVGNDNARRWLHKLELSAGLRSERYSDVGQATVPKAAFLWSPTGSLSLRGTWTKSFRPPALPELTTNASTSGVLTLPDASSPSGVTTALLASGNNPNLQDERARTWTLGAVVAPASVPGFSVALTYFNTFYSNRIEAVALEPTVLNQPELAWLVNRNFTATQRAELCQQTLFEGLPGDCLDAPIAAIVDARLQNMEYLQTQGIDLIGKYGFSDSMGRFDLDFNGTYLLDYSEQKTPGSPVVQLLSTQNNPINLRFRGSLSWQRSGLGASFYVNFANHYRDTLSVPNRDVGSFTTFDVQARYLIDPNSPGFLGNTEFAITALNLLDSSPPFLNNPVGVGYDQENADLTGRILSVSVRKRW